MAAGGVSGFRCWCGAQTFVLRTDGNTRRRECFNQHRFTTEEVLKPDRRFKKQKPMTVLELRAALRPTDKESKGKYGFKKGEKG